MQAQAPAPAEQAQQTSAPQQTQPEQAQPVQPAQGATGDAVATPTVPTTESLPPASQSFSEGEATHGKRKVRAAQDAYLAGAKRLEHDDLSGAEHEFTRALQLDPGNREYAIALSIARDHRVTELVQQAGQARLAGHAAQAGTLLAEASAIDPLNPMVLEHSNPAMLESAVPASPAVPQRGRDDAATQTTPVLTDRAKLIAAAAAREPWQQERPVLAGALQLRPATTLESFHLRGDSQEILRSVASSYGIRVTFDDSAEHKILRFDLDNQPYAKAMSILMEMAHVFAVPLEATSVLIAKDDIPSHDRLQRLLEETVYLPGSTPEQIGDLANVIRNIFGVRQINVQPSSQTIVLRAPEDTLAPMNRTLEDLVDGGGEVMLEVKMVEVTTTRTRNIGATIPTQAGIYNVDAAATALVNANQTLVQQSIAQGFVSATASNIDIALALIGSGLVQSALLSSTVGFFGHGLTETGITASTNTSFSLAQNTADTRMLDDIQVRVDDRQPATFRAGTKYPITTSTYTTGLSTPASALSNATINGVSVASLLAQYAGGTSATIPQVTYEDLGVTLKTTPVLQKSGRINLTLDLKIEALAGGSANGIPVLASRQFTSDITIADGESAMLVSNTNRTETAAVTGVPGLSELPGFQVPVDQNAEKDAGQLIVMVTPHVVRRRSDTVASPRIVIRTQDARVAASD